MMPTAASANSPTAYTILDVDQNAYLFVGGIIGTVKVCLSVCLFPQRLEPATSGCVPVKSRAIFFFQAKFWKFVNLKVKCAIFVDFVE